MSPQKTVAAEPVAATTSQLLELVQAALERLKAEDIHPIDVRAQTGITDFMVLASGNSTRHVKSIADEVQRAAKAAGKEVLGIEGESGAEWVLVDLGDVLVHILLPKIRDLYRLERLWEGTDTDESDRAYA